MTQNLAKKFKVLFVCLGNICRSPAAEGVLQKRISERGWTDRVLVDSAGTSNFHTGKPADSRMMQAAESRGYTLLSRARSLIPQDLRDFDLIVAMDSDNFREIHRMAHDQASHVRMLSEFLDESWPRNVPDPYHGGPEGFEYVLDMLEAAAPKILDELIAP